MSNNLPLISVALCSFNGSRYIVEQLDSILNQTYKNIEIVVLDDCSTDNTVNLLIDYSEKYPQIKVFRNQKNMGVDRSFAKVLTFCKGDYIAISDQDDIWMSNKLEDAYNRIDDAILVYSNSELIDEDGTDMHRRMYRKTNLYSGSDPRAISLNHNIAGHTMFFKASLLNDVLPIPAGCNYDWWIPFVAANQGEIKYMDFPYVKHRMHSGNAYKEMGNLSVKESLSGLKRWSDAMLMASNLKYRNFFEELNKIVSGNVFWLKKIKFVLFQMKYRNVIYNNKGFFSKMNRARKIGTYYVPG